MDASYALAIGLGASRHIRERLLGARWKGFIHAKTAGAIV